MSYHLRMRKFTLTSLFMKHNPNDEILIFIISRIEFNS